MTLLITGGARSGKSAQAERLAADSGLDVVYIATALAKDAEMRERIRHHRARRPENWRTVEAPIALAAALSEHAAPSRCLVVDCLTLWLTNLIFADEPQADESAVLVRGRQFETQRNALLTTLPALPGTTILVGNEIGMGIVPMTPLSRFFTDENGRLNQAVAALSSEVCLMVAGCPLWVRHSR